MKSLIKQYRNPDIKFFKDGKIYITSRVSKSIGLESGDAIDVVFDKGKYYLYVSRKKAPQGYVARCYKTKATGRFMRCNSKEISAGILKAAQATEKAFLLVGRAELLPEAGRFGVTINVNNNLYEPD